MKVLLVDDEPKNLLALSALLEDMGAEVHCAQSGEEALRRVLERDFAAILLDVRMPGIDGFETAAAIRSVEPVKRMPIIFLSAHGDRRGTPRRDPLVEFVVKPVDPNLMRLRIAAHLKNLAAPSAQPFLRARCPGKPAW